MNETVVNSSEGRIREDKEKTVSVIEIEENGVQREIDIADFRGLYNVNGRLINLVPNSFT